MLNLIQATANPQIFEYDNWAGLPALLTFVGLFAAAILVRLAGTPLSNRWHADPNKVPGSTNPARPYGYAAVTLFAAALLTILVFVVIFLVTFLSQLATYEQSVSEWLASDYNTEVSAEFAGRLLTESLVVDLDGSRQVVSLVEGSDGRLEVVNEAGDVVGPRS